MEGISKDRFMVRSVGAIGHDTEVVKNQLIKHLKISEAQATRIIARQTTLKKNLSEDQAQRFIKSLAKLGLQAELVVQSDAAAPVANTRSQVATGAQAGFVSTTDVQSVTGNEPVTQEKPAADSHPKLDKSAHIRQLREEGQQLMDLFNETFQFPIDRLPVTLGYRAGLVCVMLISLIAPLIYFSLIVGAAYATWSYASLLPSFFEHRSPNIFSGLALMIPILMGFIFTLFLAKPLFATYSQQSDLLLDRTKYKRFYRLIELLADRMNVPAPANIYVNNEVNASVAPEKGLASLLKGNLIITVGLPLLAGMDSRQFLGVIAHEFGHFTQRNAMFASHIVNHVNAWMWQCAFGEDNWDRRLNKWSEHSPLFVIDIGIFVCRYLIKATR